MRVRLMDTTVMGREVANAIAFLANTRFPFFTIIAWLAFELLPRYSICYLAQTITVPNLLDGLMADITAKIFFRFGHLFTRNHFSISAYYHGGTSGGTRTPLRPSLLPSFQ